MFNKVILIGNLTKDPEIRYTTQGTPVSTLRLAVTTKHKSADEWKDETLFIDIVVFGKQAESCSQYLSKGSPALVEGRLQERSWEKDGQKKSKMEVVAQSVKFLPKRTGGDQQAQRDDAAPPAEISDIEPF